MPSSNKYSTFSAFTRDKFVFLNPKLALGIPFRSPSPVAVSELLRAPSYTHRKPLPGLPNECLALPELGTSDLGDWERSVVNAFSALSAEKRASLLSYHRASKRVSYGLKINTSLGPVQAPVPEHDDASPYSHDATTDVSSSESESEPEPNADAESEESESDTTCNDIEIFSQESPCNTDENGWYTSHAPENSAVRQVMDDAKSKLWLLRPSTPGPGNPSTPTLLSSRSPISRPGTPGPGPTLAYAHGRTVSEPTPTVRTPRPQSRRWGMLPSLPTSRPVTQVELTPAAAAAERFEFLLSQPEEKPPAEAGSGSGMKTKTLRLWRSIPNIKRHVSIQNLKWRAGTRD